MVLVLTKWEHGGYKKALMVMGKVKRYDAFDGAPFSEKDSQGTAKHMDLTIPQLGLKLYDSVLATYCIAEYSHDFSLFSRST
jgi:hypothetical protein